MAKNIELLNSYSNTNKAAMVQKIESAEAAQGGFYTVFYGQDGNVSDRKNPEFTALLQEEISSKFPEANILATVAPDGKRAVVCYTTEPLKEIVEKYQDLTGEKMKRDEREIPFAERYELTKWRGHLGNIGQVFILLSGLGANKYVAKLWGETAQAKDKFSSPEKVVSTIASVAGNGLNSWFGVQKKPDDLRLSIVKRKSNTYLHKYSSEPLNLPDNHDRVTPYTWREKPETTDEKTKVFFEQNAGILSEVLKIVGKYSYFQGGAKKGNDGDRVHGAVSMAAKFVTVLGKDEDPYGLENSNDWFSRLRQKSNFIAGGMEWVANISQFAGALTAKVTETLRPDHVLNWSKEAQTKFEADYRPKYDIKEDDKGEFFVDKDSGKKIGGFALVGKEGAERQRDKPSPGWQMVDFKNSFLMNWKQWDWLQLIGAGFFTLSLTTKMMAPFTEKKVNVEELFAHNAVGIASLPEYQRADRLAGLTQHLIEMKAPSGMDMLPELTKMGLASAYAGMANTLYQRHQWDIPAQSMRTTTKAVETAEVKEFEKEEAAQTAFPAKSGEAEKIEKASIFATAVEPAAAVSELSGNGAPDMNTPVPGPTIPQEQGPALHVADLRDRIQEARDRGTGAFAEKFGQTEGMALSTAASAS